MQSLYSGAAKTVKAKLGKKITCLQLHCFLYFDVFVPVSALPMSWLNNESSFLFNDSRSDGETQSSSIVLLCRSGCAWAKLSLLLHILRSRRCLSALWWCWHKEASVFPIDKDYFCQEQHSWAYLRTRANKCPSLWLSITTTRQQSAYCTVPELR